MSTGQQPRPRGLPAPAQWLEPLAISLLDRLTGARILGVAAGSGWLSLGLGDGFLWMVARAGLRMLWWSETPLDRRRLTLLGQRSSPLSESLAGRRIVGTSLLVSDDDVLEGWRLHLDDPSGHLSWRGWPRPGAIYLSDDDGTVRAQDGRMDRSELREVPLAQGELDRGNAFDGSAHHEQCRALFERHLATELRGRLDRALRQRAQALERKHAHLLGDIDPPEEIDRWRREADLLAAHLHEVPPQASAFECEDFEGAPTVIALDPRLAAHENLDRAYRKVRRAQQRTTHVQQQLEGLESRREELAERLSIVEKLDEADVDTRLEWAARWKIELGPPPDHRSEKARPPRLPYWSYLFEEQWSLKVGRSARDNDAMLRQHKNGRDLWLHAQAVAGSHVILRSAGAPVAARVLEAAAQLAAHFSKARNSETVAVICTERRYVRKPRKAAPGLVVAERERTLFVTPKIAKGMVKVDS